VPGVFIASCKLAGLVITEFNTDRDAHGTLAHRFIAVVAKALEKEMIKSGKERRMCA
jgi:hypothetical protein